MKPSKIILLSLLLFTIASCTPKQKFKGQALNLVVSAAVKGLDPIYANDYYSSGEVARVYEGLLEYHYLKRPYVLKANLAESMPEVSEDGLTYTFKIKKGIRFHDDPAFKDKGGQGRELVAEDFVYSIKRLADPKLQGLGWWLLDGKLKGLSEWREKYAKLPQTNYGEEVEGLKALDRYTLQFKLAKPFPQFLYALAMPFTFAVAREVVEHYGKEFLNHPVGTGPFMIQDGVFKQSKKIIYLKNPHYRVKKFPCEASKEYRHIAQASCGQRLPLVDKIVVNIIEEDQPRWLNFQKGKVDFIGVPKDNFGAAIPDARNLSPEFKEKGIKLIISPSLNVSYTAFSHDLDLFKNVKLRQAMSLAFDINVANKLFHNNTALPAQSLIPPGIAGYEKDYRNPYRGEGRSQDIAQAKKLLAEAGYPGGQGLPEITHDRSNSTVSRQIGEYFKKQMAQIGIKIKLILNPWPELQKKITTRRVMTYGIGWGADYPDAENFLQLLYGPNRAPGANGSGYDNPVFNKLFKQASIQQDGPERTKLYQKLNRMAAEEMPIIYGVHRQSYVLKHSWLKNYVSTDFEAGRSAYLGIDREKKSQNLKRL